MIVKLIDIEITQEDRINILKIWEVHKAITRNLDNVLKDFNFINQNITYELLDENNEAQLAGVKGEKMKLLNSHIGGMVCMLAPDSNFNKNHVTESGESKEEVTKKEKSAAFAASLK